MIERQSIKLKMDSVIIQKGRQAQAAQMKKEEIQDIANYGADQIFKIGEDIQDEDINKMIEDGLKRAKELQ